MFNKHKKTNNYRLFIYNKLKNNKLKNNKLVYIL